MKSNNHLIKYIDKRISAIHQILEMKPAHWKPETFHNIRVEIKKINAVFDLINFCAGNFHRKKVFRPFKVVFKRAGEVRDLQIEEVFLKKNKIILSGQQLPGKTTGAVQDAKKKFFNAINKKFFKDILRSTGQAKKRISSIRKNDLNEYFKSGFLEMEILLKKKLNARQLHRLRRQLKRNYFNLKAINIRSRIPYWELNKYLDLLGRWHDRRVTLLWLHKNIDARKLTVGKRKRVSKLKSNLVSQSKRLHEMIIQRNKKIVPLIERMIVEFKEGV